MKRTQLWIEHIPYEKAEGRLRQLYDRVKGPGDNVDNIMLAHSLRPHSMEGHMALYKSVLHHSSNKLPKWFLETLGVLVSLRNGCRYCVDHHFAGLKRLLKDDGRAKAIRAHLEGSADDPQLDARMRAAIAYAIKLTERPAQMSATDTTQLRDAGFADGEILEINQLVAYFAYANRTVLGLGVNSDGDDLGLSPGNSDDPEDWNHR